MMDDSCAPSNQEASISEELTRHQMEQEELLTQSGKLKTDNMSHSDKNLFVCTHCDKAFDRSTLKIHKLLLEKPFASTLCTYCAATVLQ